MDVLVVLTIILSIIIYYFIFFVRKAARAVKEWKRRKRIEYVQHTSERLVALFQLNMLFSDSFSSDVRRCYLIRRHPKSKHQFDAFQPDTCAAMVVDERCELFRKALRLTEENRTAYDNYQGRLKRIFLSKPTPQRFPRGLFRSDEAYAKLENELLREMALNPVTSCSLVIEWSYSSPKGRNFYKSSKIYYESEIQEMLNRAGTYEKRDIGAGSKRYQRSLVTPGLRFEVLRRDGYRCCICGRSQSDGVKLEVDHIIPVSKGGKTEMNNLQTLCWECNRGKGAKIM